jgi:site-specific recombinase XerC
VISSIPLKNIPVPKVGYRLPKPIGNADFAKLLQIVEREMPEVQPSPVLERVQQPMIARFFAHTMAQKEARAAREKLITERLAQGPCLVSQMREYLRGRGLDVCETTVVNDYRRLGIAPPVANAQRLQERALLRILDSCGLRVSEVTALNSKDLKLNEGYLFVRQSKGDKDRFVPMDQPAIDALRDYLQRSRGILYPGEKSDRVFPITRQRAWQIIQALGKQAGTSELYHPHQLRHRFGTEMTKAGMGQREVADLMGHSSVDTTQGYVALDTGHLEESFRKFHPRAVIK